LLLNHNPQLQLHNLQLLLGKKTKMVQHNQAQLLLSQNSLSKKKRLKRLEAPKFNLNLSIMGIL
jgi:hypothetical protein